MKVKFLLVLLLLALPCVAFARKLAPEVEHAMAYGAEAKICLKVCDDTGARGHQDGREVAPVYPSMRTAVAKKEETLGTLEIPSSIHSPSIGFIAFIAYIP